MTRHVTIELLRNHLGDRMSDAALNRQGDVTWDDPELYECMEAAARSYNSLPPHIGRVTDVDKLDATTDMFLDAAAAAALERCVRKKVAERVAFQAGGIETDPDGVVIDGMLKLAATLRAKFAQEARAYKGTRNMERCFGRVG